MAHRVLVVIILLLLVLPSQLAGHPLGNFSVNRYSRIVAGADALHVFYVLDLAEIPTFQELPLIDVIHDGRLSDEEQRQYLESTVEALQRHLYLAIDHSLVELKIISSSLEFLPGQGGLQTLRLNCTFLAPIPWETSSVLRVEFRDDNFANRLGWKEIVARGDNGMVLKDSSVPSADISHELRSYPDDMLASPLDVQSASFTLIKSSSHTSATDTRTADQTTLGKKKDAFAALISGEELSFSFILFALFAAMFWGAAHALSPGHGKTVVAAYLVGSRGTAKHAIFLGATVTATHTIGVFALGLITLFASQYILPEKLYPWLSLISGVIVVGIGVYLIVQRLGKFSSHHHTHSHSHSDSHEHLHLHAEGEHEHPEHEHIHTHGGKMHSPLPPGAAEGQADGTPVTWKSLFALGVSGGLLPCPSALVVLLSAISLHRVGFGLLLIVAFSIGLAGVLTGIGLLLVYARRYFERFRTDSAMIRLLPAISAAIIVIAGLVITAQAFTQLGMAIPSISEIVATLSQPTIVSVLGLGFVLGLKHALDADHLVAVTTIVSEKRGLLSSSLVGAVWGLGHTAALLVVGILVILLQTQIPPRLAMAMEFAVAIMLVLLGVNLLWKLLRSKDLHTHVHEHGGHFHVHPHLHEHSEIEQSHTHHGVKIGGLPFSGRPFFIGLVHGMTGSAALMLLVLATIPSPVIGLLYIAIFGIGSIGGMLLMSTAISLPFAFTATRFLRLNFAVRAVAGLFSIGLGIFMMYEIGFVDGLFL